MRGCVKHAGAWWENDEGNSWWRGGCEDDVISSEITQYSDAWWCFNHMPYSNFSLSVGTFLSVARLLVGEQEDVLWAAVALDFVSLQQPVHPLDHTLQALINVQPNLLLHTNTNGVNIKKRFLKNTDTKEADWTPLLPTPPRANLPGRRSACFYSRRCHPEELHGEKARWRHETGRRGGGRGSVTGNERRARGRRRTGTGCLA